ncbi:hypothetical protein M0802_016291 [Mischocyttarus mexicanus]|nr:hypothetical protein M0802_016291 [Mischocyttarus mexicanus]
MSRIRLDYLKINPEKLEISLVQNFKRLREGFFSEMLSQGLLKDKTLLILNKSTTVRTFFSKNNKSLRQSFLSKKLRKSQNKVIGRDAKFRRRFQYSLVKVMSRIRLDYVKTNPEKLEIFLVQNFKRLRQGFLSKKLSYTIKCSSGLRQQKVKVKSKQSDRQEGHGSKKLLVQFSHG